MKLQRVTWLKQVRNFYSKLVVTNEGNFLGSGLSHQTSGRWMEAIPLEQFISELIANGYSGVKPKFDLLKELVGRKRRFTSKFKNKDEVFFLSDSKIAKGRITETIARVDSIESIIISYKVKQAYDNKEVERMESTLFANKEELGEAIKKMTI